MASSLACIVSFQVLYFNLPLYSRHTNPPGRNLKRARPRRGAAGAGHDHVPGGGAPILAAGAGRCHHGHVPGGSAPVLAAGARPRRRRRPRPALASIAVLDVFFAAAVGVGVVDLFFAAAGRNMRLVSNCIPRRRRCCGPILRRGRPQHASSIKLYTCPSKTNFKLQTQGHSCALKHSSTLIYTHVLRVQVPGCRARHFPTPRRVTWVPLPAWNQTRGPAQRRRAPERASRPYGHRSGTSCAKISARYSGEVYDW